MSAIARFLVEFEPSPAASPGRRLPSPSPSRRIDGDAIEDLDDDAFGWRSGAGTSTSNRTTGSGSPRATPRWPTGGDVGREAVAPAGGRRAAFSERIATLEEEHARTRAEDRAAGSRPKVRPWPRRSGRPRPRSRTTSATPWRRCWNP